MQRAYFRGKLCTCFTKILANKEMNTVLLNFNGKYT